MNAPASGAWELFGYVLWLVGSALFAVVSWRNGDTLSLIGSVLFFVGIVAVMVPMVQAYLENRKEGASPSPVASPAGQPGTKYPARH